MYQTYIYDKISDQDYVSNLKDRKSQAKSGHTKAQIEYATACLYGVTIKGKKVFKKDLKDALKYTKKLTAASNADGWVLYALMQIHGEGTTKNHQGAYESLLEAVNCDSKNRDAQYLLAYLYFTKNFESVSLDIALKYLNSSGRSDKHKIKQAMGDLGIIYFEGQHVEQDCPFALEYLIEAAPTYPPANESLRDCTKFLTDSMYRLDVDSRPKSIYEASNFIKENNGGKIDKVVDSLLKWSQEKGYPLAIYDYAIHHMESDTDYCQQRMVYAASQLLLLAIDFCGSIKSLQREQLMKYVKQSLYFKSLKHLETGANLYRESATKSSFNLGIYFRYKKSPFSQSDEEFIEDLKIQAWKEGSESEQFAYAICLENGFNGLEKDVETAVMMYKSLSDKGYNPASRNYAHFQEFAEYAPQDLSSAIKKLEQYNDLEAQASINMMKIMLSDHPEFPFPYNDRYRRAQKGDDNESQIYTELALLLIKDKEMIPNYRLADKFVGKAKKSPLTTAITAAITGDPRAGKPNIKKAEKLFLEATSQDSDPEINALYAQFLIYEEREEEAQSLEVDPEDSLYSSRSKRSILDSFSHFSTLNMSTSSQLVTGSELYYKGYKKKQDVRFLERAASAGFPIAESEYAHYILKEKKKKEYSKALSYLQSSSENGIVTSFVLLGYMYHKGIEVKTNYEEAISNYSKAIEQFEYQGYAGYGLAYSTGNGFDKDYYMANRCFKIAEERNTPYTPPYNIDMSLFVNNDYKQKFEEIKSGSGSSGSGKAGKVFAEAVNFEFRKKQLQKAFVNYKKAYEYEPDNRKYKRNYAFFLMKSIGNSIEYKTAIKLYEEMRNPDDLYNASICQHYQNTHYVPFYMSEQAKELLAKVDKETATQEDYLTLGRLIKDGKKVHQQYEVACHYLLEGAKKFTDPNIYYLLGEMAEKGLGAFYSDEDIVDFFRRSAMLNEQDEFIGSPKNAKGCYKLGQMLAKGDKIYRDLHQSAFYLYKAIKLGLNDKELEKFYNEVNDELNTNKNVIDPYDDYLADFYAQEKLDIDTDLPPISDLSNPFQKWKTYDPQLESSTKVDVLFQRGYQYMKGVGIAIDYTKALENLGRAALQGHAQAQVYYAILAMMCHLSHRVQIYTYNLHQAKKSGLSLAYVEEAKVFLGLYKRKNVVCDDVEEAKELLKTAIAADDPYALYIQGRYLEDEDSLQLASEKGCGKASYYIGKRLIDEGKLDEAYSIIEKGADQGHPKAVFILGFLNKIKKNKAQAEEFMTKGVYMAGNSTIAVKYALERIQGDVIDKKEEEAFKWLKFAHDLHNMDGTLHYAICLRDGIGCQVDKKLAAIHFKLGTNMKIPEFYAEASQCHADMKGIKHWFKEKKYGSKAKKMSKKGIEAPQYPNRIIKPKFTIEAKNEYDPHYAFKLARSNKHENLAKFIQYLDIATKLGYYPAVKEKIYLLLAGLYFDRNELEAYGLLNDLINCGWPTASKIAGDIYFARQIFVEKDTALAMYKSAAEHGSKSGKFKYGVCLLNGIGCPKDREAGLTMIENSGCKYAYNYLNRLNIKSKIAKPNINVLTTLEVVASIEVSFEYRDGLKPAPPVDKKGNLIVTLNHIRALADRDIRYGICMLNKYYWDHQQNKKIVDSSMKALKAIADAPAMFAAYQYGYSLYQQKKLEDCIKYLKHAADRDNYYACHFLGRAFYDDSIAMYKSAKTYLSQSALKLNDYDDQFELVFMCEDKEAQEWLDMAVDNCPAKYAMRGGDIYRNGIKNGLNKNPNKAAKCYKRAYYYMSGDDLYRVAVLFREGNGVPKDIGEAYTFFEHGGDKGDLDCCVQCVLMYEDKQFTGSGYPVTLARKVANSSHKGASFCCFSLASYLCRTAGETDIWRYREAADYFEKSGIPEGIKNARQIRKAVDEYEEARRRAEEARRAQQQSSGSSGGGGLLMAAIGIGVLLTTGIPIF